MRFDKNSENMENEDHMLMFFSEQFQKDKGIVKSEDQEEHERRYLYYLLLVRLKKKFAVYNPLKIYL